MGEEKGDGGEELQTRIDGEQRETEKKCWIEMAWRREGRYERTSFERFGDGDNV